MTDEDIIKLASKLTQSLATKEDLKVLEVRLESKISGLGKKIDEVDKKLSKKIDDLNDKADSILVFADGVDETTTDHGKRLDRIEAIPVIAHQIKK